MDIRRTKKFVCEECGRVLNITSMFNNNLCMSCNEEFKEMLNENMERSEMDSEELRTKIDEENKEEWMNINEALYEAKEKFYEVLEKKYGYDGAYWALGIDVYFLSSDFSEILQTMSWDNMQYSIDGDDNK
jgi:protein-arginine kinase activator protein McsA